jgi:hypothetical protein
MRVRLYVLLLCTALACKKDPSGLSLSGGWALLSYTEPIAPGVVVLPPDSVGLYKLQLGSDGKFAQIADGVTRDSGTYRILGSPPTLQFYSANGQTYAPLDITLRGDTLYLSMDVFPELTSEYLRIP